MKGRSLWSLKKTLKSNNLSKINWDDYIDVENWDLDKIKKSINETIDIVEKEVDTQVDDIKDYID